MPHRTLARVKPLTAWFSDKGWAIYPHQLAMLEAAENGKSTLLIAPTGGGKTLAGFLPSIVDLALNSELGLHTIYISPLKALTSDVERNLLAPINDLKLPIRVEIRTGDTSSSRKKRQFKKPPHILLTTPESLELLLSYPDAAAVLGNVRRVIIDEVHALAPGKRGHLTALCVNQLRHLSPDLTVNGLSATVASPEKLAAWIGDAEIIRAVDTIKPRIRMLDTEARIPWGGYMATYAVKDIYEAIKKAGNTIVFVNTRAQAEWLFQQLWLRNDDNLSIGLHHGSLDRAHRQKVEASMAEGALRAIVATASLDLGLDWGAVDLVIQVGAPKGISRLLQRIGRSNHRYNEPSEALLVPTNRFETLECIAVMRAIAEGDRDSEPIHPGSLDVLAQFVMNRACAGPFDADQFYREIRKTPSYSYVTAEDFAGVMECVAHGGYALRAYERFQRILQDETGLWSANPQAIRRHRMNTGTIVEYETIPVGLKRKGASGFRNLGQIEDFFIQGLTAGDTFLFGGRLLKFLGVREDRVMTENATGTRPKIPSFMGGKLPLSLTLAERVLDLLMASESWKDLPAPTKDWLQWQKERSELPARGTLLIETFPHEKLSYTVLYTFAGRSANQTLGLLLTHAMEELDLLPLGFVASDYALAIWGMRDVTEPEILMKMALNAHSIDDWINRSQMAKRAFREVAVIAGLVERNYAGKRKSGRQVTVSTDLIYEVLLHHEPGHILLRATRGDVETRIAGIDRLNEQLRPLTVHHRHLERASPLAIPLLLEVGIEKVKGKAQKELLSIHEMEIKREKEGDRLLTKARSAA
jgi:ATP-dependent Lhr-like helicase